MRILVYPHDLGMGGSQLNAIELAAAVRDLGHEVVLYGEPGVLLWRAEELGLEFIGSPRRHTRPTPTIVAHLRKLVSLRGIDIIHGYEWPPILEGRLAALVGSAACVGTVMSMSVAPFIPRQLPLVVGTKQIARVERGRGRTDVTVIEPPVDTQHNRPGVVSSEKFRGDHGIGDGPLVVVVTRFARELKLEGVLTAIDVVPDIGADVTLALVGSGPEKELVEAAAARVNARLGRTAVILTGQLEDPRPAYAAADVVLGMGGSALRAMAFAKPLVVQGEQGYWRALTPETLGEFELAGWYGVGGSPAEGAAALRSELLPLLGSASARQEAAEFAFETLLSGYSLSSASTRQVHVYHRALQGQAGRRLYPLSDLRAAAGLSRYIIDRRMPRRRSHRPDDDFNAIPIASRRRG